MSHETDQSNLLTSLLVNRQVPEFVREEHPLFISFLEAYYEFLETEQGTQNNDLTKVSKDLRNIQDVDYSIAAFERSFLNTYGNLLPNDATVDKDFLIKNILPLYLAKGNPKSFLLLFRMFFGQEAEITFPTDKVLRASDGEYTSTQIITITPSVSTFYVGDGSTNIFRLSQVIDPDDIIVRIDGQRQVIHENYFLRKEDKQIVFYTAPSSDADVRVEYSNFDVELFNERKITGATSNATTIVQGAFPRRIDPLPKIELFFDREDIVGSFNQFEQITSTIIVDGDIINVSGNTFSSIDRITVTDGGRLYNIGDAVIIKAGGFTKPATAQVESVLTEFLSDPTLEQGGAGFEVGGLLQGGNTSSGFVLYTIEPAIDTSGNNTPNSFILMGQTYDNQVSGNSSQTYADLVIANANGSYASAFANAQIASPTVDSRICHVVNSYTTAVNIGPIQNVRLITSNTLTESLPLDGTGALAATPTGTADVGSLNSLGKLTIHTGGLNHDINDIIFFEQKPFGRGGLARVSETNSNGTITNTEFESPFYENHGLGVRNNEAFIANVSANVGFNGLDAVPNVYVSNTVVDISWLDRETYPSVNVGLSGVYMTPQSNHAGLSFFEGDNPVRPGDLITILGHERTVVNVSGMINLNAIGYNVNSAGMVTQNTGTYQSYSSNLSLILDSQVGNTGNAGGYLTRTIDPGLLKQFAGLNVRPVFHYTSGPNTKSQIMLDDINVDSMVYTFGEWSSSQNTALSSFTRFDGSLQYPYYNNGGYLGGYNPTTSQTDMVNQWEQRSPRMGSNTADYGQAFSGTVGFSGVDFNATYTRLFGTFFGEFSGGERGRGRWVIMDTNDFSVIGSTEYRNDFGQYDDLNFQKPSIGNPFTTSNTNTFGAEANGQIIGAWTGSNWLERATANVINLPEPQYIYANTYGANNSHFWLRGPVMTLSQDPTFQYASCLFGDAVGTLNVHFDVVEGNSNPETYHSGGFLTVDSPFPPELDFLTFANSNYFGTRGMANTLDANSVNAHASNIYGVGMCINTHFPKGGMGYDPDFLPAVSSIFRSNVQNTTANNGSSVTANLEINCLMGDGEIITATSGSGGPNEGKIGTIRIVDPGLGYTTKPTIDLSDKGDTNATAVAVLTDSVRTIFGRFTSSKGLLSAKERRIQGKDYYQDYVYVTNVPVEFNKYKTILKGLIHPAGYKNYAEYTLNKPVNTILETTQTLQNTMSGRVNVNSSVIVTGTNTLFNIAVSQGIITVGTSKLAVNGENRVISSVVSNTDLRVSSAFTMDANSQTAIILV